MRLSMRQTLVCPGCGEYGHKADECPKHSGPRVPRSISHGCCDDCGAMPDHEHAVGCSFDAACDNCGALPDDPHDAACDEATKADEKLQALKEDGPRHDLNEYDAEVEEET